MRWPQCDTARDQANAEDNVAGDKVSGVDGMKIPVIDAHANSKETDSIAENRQKPFEKATVPVDELTDNGSGCTIQRDTDGSQ